MLPEKEEDEEGLLFSVTPFSLRSERTRVGRGGESWRRRCLCLGREEEEEEEEDWFEIG